MLDKTYHCKYYIILAVRGICFLLFSPERGPETLILGLDPSQPLNYSRQLRSVQFLVCGVRQVSRSSFRGRGACPPPLLRHKAIVLCRRKGGDRTAPLLRHKTMVLCANKGGMSAVSHSIHVCCATQQTCLLCDTASLAAA